MNEQLSFLGWSQAELGRRLGVTPAAVTSWRKRGAPRAVVAYLDAMVRMRQAADDLHELTRRPKRRPRGRSAVTAWERSATDSAQQAPDADYRRKLEQWGEADLDQSEGWGEG